MDKNNLSSFSNGSVDDLLEKQLTAIRFQNLDASEYQSESVFMPNSGSLYYTDQFQSAEARNTLPFVFNTREDVVPAMVGMGGGNYMVFGTAAEKSVSSTNNHFANKTNGTLSGMNNFQVEYPADYNLFAGGMSPSTSSFNSHSDSNTSSTPQLIENLVGHWASDQSGTYSPFGSCIAGGQGQQAKGLLDRGAKKTRIVAEVRPMRPSYSDVLSKSVSNQSKLGKPADGKPREVKEVKNGKAVKSSIGRSLSGNSNVIGRHNLTDDVTRSGSNSSLKTAGMKKSTDTEPEEPMTKKWVSLDDLTGGNSENNFMDDVKTKKNITKHTSANKVKDGWETIQLGNNKSPVNKAPAAKKMTPVTTAKSSTGLKEKETSSGLKFEQTKSKTPPDERRAPTTQNKCADGNKSSRRNSRGLQAERAKRNGRGRRRDTENWWTAMLAQRVDVVVAYVLWAARWLVSLVLDVFALSTNLGFYMFTVFWSSSVNSISENYANVCHWLRDLSLSQRITSSRFWPFRRRSEKTSSSSDSDSDSDSGEPVGEKKKRRLPGGLKQNLPLPSTGEEAMKRLLSCKGKDPYSILGVSQDCSDDDIKRYYKRQAFLVHPDKNSQPGAEEAFKILVHAFDIIGEPEHRKTYDRSVEKSAQAAQAWSELSDLLAQLHKKMEYVANTIKCTNCGKRHKRTVLNRPLYAARTCAQCKICHSAREGDIWAETVMFGMKWRYYACMDGGLYDISEWASCQGNNLKNLKANTHQVQYRIVLGRQANKTRSQPTASPGSEPDLEEFINNLYSKPESGPPSDVNGDGGVRSRKHKRKK